MENFKTALFAGVACQGLSCVAITHVACFIFQYPDISTPLVKTPSAKYAFSLSVCVQLTQDGI